MGEKWVDEKNEKKKKVKNGYCVWLDKEKELKVINSNY